MKRPRSLLAALLAAPALMAACSSSPSSTAATNPSDTSRTITHIMGEATIEGVPERVVTLGLTDQDPVMALGVTPVAAQAWYSDIVVYPWAEEVMPDAEVEIIPSGEISPEQIRTFRPDLIVAVSTDLTDTQYEQLSAIAPTISAPEGTTPATVTWQQQTEIIGEALDREEEAAALIEGVEADFAEISAAHPDWEGLEAVLASQYYDGQLLVYPSESPSTELLTGVGFTMSTGTDALFDDALGVAALSAERFDLIDVDLVLFDADEEILAETGLLDIPTFQNLSVVQEGRVVFPPPGVTDAVAFKNVLSIPWALERLEEPIADALG